jgi:hypothetical protein
LPDQEQAGSGSAESHSKSSVFLSQLDQAFGFIYQWKSVGLMEAIVKCMAYQLRISGGKRTDAQPQL